MASSSWSRFELSSFLFLDIIYLTVQYRILASHPWNICRFILVIALNRNRVRDHISVSHKRPAVVGQAYRIGIIIGGSYPIYKERGRFVDYNYIQTGIVNVREPLMSHDPESIMLVLAVKSLCGVFGILI